MGRGAAIALVAGAFGFLLGWMCLEVKEPPVPPDLRDRAEVQRIGREEVTRILEERRPRDVERAIAIGKRATAKNKIGAIEAALALFWVDHSCYPDSLDELTADHSEFDLPGGYISKIPVDPWGEEYIYDSEGGTGKRYLILSKGEDRLEGTDDDISNEQ